MSHISTASRLSARSTRKLIHGKLLDPTGSTVSATARSPPPRTGASMVPSGISTVSPGRPSFLHTEVTSTAVRIGASIMAA
jgi:hypothetical protein